MSTMEKFSYHGINLVIADPMPNTLKIIREILRDMGFRNINTSTTLKGLRRIIESPVATDLLVTDIEFPDGNACELIHGIRHHEIGSVPFLPIIATINDAGGNIVPDTIDAGVDNLLLKPLSRKHFMDSVDLLIKDRKPFVVTTDYVGPDRRSGSRPGTMKIPHIDVPNILRSKALGEDDKTLEIQEALNKAMSEIQDQKIERHAYQIDYLVVRILPGYASGKVFAVKEDVDRLGWVSQDASQRVESTKHAHLGELFSTIADVVWNIQRAHPEPDKTDLDLLTQLSKAVRLATASETAEDAQVIKLIAHTVNQLKANRKG